MKTNTQTALIRAYLKKGRTLTPLEALNRYGCFRLSARIHELKREGLPIECTLVADASGAHFAQYRLAC